MLITIGVILCLLEVSVSEAGYSCGERPHGARIIGGETAPPNSWPWQLSLRVNGYHSCGATLINNNWAVTAAHCVTERRVKYSVMAGGHHIGNRDGRGEIVNVAKVISHPGYASKRRPDLAVLQLSRPVELSSTIIPACLPRQGQVVSQRGNCYISGWGMDNGGSASTYLKQSKVPVYTHEECTRKIWVSKKDNICLGGSGSSACFGDSGGPLVCEESGKWVLRGASSYVTGKNCPVHKYSVYARVSSYIDWIYDNMGAAPPPSEATSMAPSQAPPTPRPQTSKPPPPTKPGGCTDNHSNCNNFQNFCRVSSHIRQICKKTCRQC